MAVYFHDVSHFCNMQGSDTAARLTQRLEDCASDVDEESITAELDQYIESLSNPLAINTSPIVINMYVIAHCLLPIAYRLLPVAYRLLPIAYCKLLLPIPGLLIPN